MVDMNQIVVMKVRMMIHIVAIKQVRIPLHHQLQHPET